jgi:hypothetical protein
MWSSVCGNLFLFSRHEKWEMMGIGGERLSNGMATTTTSFYVYKLR